MKKTLKRLLSSTLALVMVVGLAACSSSKPAADSSPAEASTASSTAEAPAAETPAAGTIKIGWSVYTMKYDFFQKMTAGVVEKCEELGYELIQHDQEENESEMVTGCQNLISQGIDVLMVSPCKPEAMSNIVDLAHAEGIPVIIVDIGDGDSDKDAIIISDVYGGGQLGGKYALQLLGEKGTEGKEVAIIKCEESAVYAIRRGEGFKNIMEGAGYSVVKELTANSNQDEGYTVMQDILASNPDIVAVFAENDPMAAGAAQAIEEAGKDIIVIGFNGDDVAMDAIKEKTMQGTVAQDPRGMGSLGVELATTVSGGGTISYDDAATKEVFAPVFLIGNEGTEITVD